MNKKRSKTIIVRFLSIPKFVVVSANGYWYVYDMNVIDMKNVIMCVIYLVYFIRNRNVLELGVCVKRITYNSYLSPNLEAGKNF